MIEKRFINSVISIGTIINNTVYWNGTGFIVFKENKDNVGYAYLVTNKHVVENKNEIVIKVNLNDGTSENITLSLENALRSDDPNIDIVLIPIDGNSINLDVSTLCAIDIDDNALTSDEFLNSGKNIGEVVYMLGFPLGLVLDEINSPLARQGIVSRIDRHEILKTHRFIVDIQNFPGNSGSPIFISELSLDKYGTVVTKNKLIGIVNSYIPYVENIISSQTKNIVGVKYENSGLARVFPVEEIKRLLE